VSTPRMTPLMELMTKSSNSLYISNYSVRPGKLFSGVDMNLTIILFSRHIRNNQSEIIKTTRYNRWNENFRNYLFDTLFYSNSNFKLDSTILKLGDSIEEIIFTKITKFKILALRKIQLGETIYYHSGGRYWRKCIKSQLSNEYKALNLEKGWGDVAISVISSSLYYWYWILISDCYHVTKRDIDFFPLPDTLLDDHELITMTSVLLEDLDLNKEERVRNRKDGSIVKEINYFVGKSKSILDQIDNLLACHYGFSEEELDFIINYDIKYRMGKELENENEE